MASKYWIKLYHEVLDDPKMGRLSDRLYRRTIECFLMAGDNEQGGDLPSLEDIAWRLRADLEQLETELHELARVGILTLNGGIWSVTNFADRQGPVPAKERMQRMRDRKRHEEYEGYAPGNEAVTSTVTKRKTDKDIDIDKDKDKEEEKKTTRFPASLNTVEFRETWQTWLDWRRTEKRKKVSPTAESRQLSKLAVHSVDVAIAMINQSIENDWQGIFELKTSKNGSQPRQTAQERNMALVQRRINNER